MPEMPQLVPEPILQASRVNAGILSLEKRNFFMLNDAYSLALDVTCYCCIYFQIVERT